MPNPDIPYLPRIVDQEITEVLAGLSAVAIQGLKGVGKTVTAQNFSHTTYRLDEVSVQQVLAADPSLIYHAKPPVLLDEWQRLPEIWDRVRRAVDDGIEPGHFLLTGSTPPPQVALHSGAGRIVITRMRPLSLAERQLDTPTVSMADLLEGNHPTIQGTTTVTLESYVDEIMSTGLPGIRALPPRLQHRQIASYIDLLVARELPELGVGVRYPGKVRAWLRAFAAAIATTTDFETIRKSAIPADNSAPPSRATTGVFRDALESLWVLDSLPGWIDSRNRLARLNQAPKHHLADPGLATYLLGVNKNALLNPPSMPTVHRDGPLLGRLFESLVVLSIRTYAQHCQAQVAHLRTSNGEREIDALVMRMDERAVAFEVKLSATVRPTDVKHLLWLKDRLGDELLDMVLINTGEHAYRRQDGIAVVPAVLLGP